MEFLDRNAGFSRDFHKMLMLRYEPVAIKLIEDEAEVPENAMRPKRDLKKHIALCQAFAMSRRDRKTVYMEKDDHWCWNPLIGLGHVECIEDSPAFDVVAKNLGMSDSREARDFFAKFPRLEKGKYKGVVTAPLYDAAFEPDLLLIYLNNARLRSVVLAVKHSTGKLVETQLDAIDSCIYACVPPMQNGQYRVTIPDIGEYERAMADEDEIIVSLPGARIEELLKGLSAFYGQRAGYLHHERDMLFDFPRPKFYNQLFELWGLDQGDEWGQH